MVAPTRNASLFTKIKIKDEGNVTFRKKGTRKIIGENRVGKNSPLSLNNVHLVEGLKFYFLSVSQICNKGNKVSFSSSRYNVVNSSTVKVTLIIHGIGETYLVYPEDIK